jgi:hypothetical protein
MVPVPYKLDCTLKVDFDNFTVKYPALEKLGVSSKFTSRHCCGSGRLYWIRIRLLKTSGSDPDLNKFSAFFFWNFFGENIL